MRGERTSTPRHSSSSSNAWNGRSEAIRVYSEDSVAGFWGKIGCLFEGILDELQNGGPDSILLDDRLMSAHSCCMDAAGNTETDDLFWKNATRKIDTLREENGPQAERALKEEKALKAAK